MFALEHGPEGLRQVLHADQIDHHGTRPIRCACTKERLDGMNVAGVVHQAVELADLAEDVLNSRIDGRSLAEVARAMR